MTSRQTFNYHTHTKRCGHAIGLDQEYIQAAIDAGFTTLGFSEHLGYDGWDDAHERIPFAQIDDYLQTMYALKQAYKDKINIRVGFEFEYFDDVVEYLQEIKSKCDYLINGQHALDRSNRYVHDACSDADVLIYADQVCKAMDHGLTDYLAHPDYFMLGRGDRGFNEACSTAMHTIAACAKKHNIPVEINLKGLRYGKQRYPYGERYLYPHRETFEIMAAHGCNVVYGYDAHDPKSLLDHEQEIRTDEVIEGLSLHFIKDLVL